jgi:hypothetical protein
VKPAVPTPTITPAPNGDEGTTLVTFGKHKGKSFADVYEQEKGYVRWALEQEGSGTLLPLQRYFRLRESGPLSPVRTSAPPSPAVSSPARTALAGEWGRAYSVARPSDAAAPPDAPRVAPARPAFGQAQPKALDPLGPVPRASGGSRRSASFSAAGPVAGLAAVAALPLLGVNETLRVPPELGVRVCAEAVNAFLEAHPDEDLMLVRQRGLIFSLSHRAQIVVEPDAGRRAALAKQVRDRQRFATRNHADVAALAAAAGSGAEAPCFALVETSWRMQPVPGAATRGLAKLLAGSDALRSLAKDALRTAGLQGADVGRSYAAGPFDPAALLTAAGRAAAPRLRFVVACVVPNANPAKADCVEDAAQLEALLRSAYDSAFDAFLRAYNRHSE